MVLMKYNRVLQLLVLALLVLLALVQPPLAVAQTQIHLPSQGRQINFTNFQYTKPVKSGNQTPATCSPGELFYLVGALPGNNLHACSNTNTWARIGGIPSLAGQTGKVLTNDGVAAQWVNLAGDVTGFTSGLKVTGLQNRSVADQAPVDGQVLVWNGTTHKWEPQGLPVAAGSVVVKSQGTLVGSRPVQNFLPGFGLVQVIADTGSEVNIQPSVNSAIVETRSNLQAGVTLRCQSAGTAGAAFQCELNPSLLAYQKGMVLFWEPDMDASGAVTLNVDTLGLKPVKLEGGEDPADGDIVGGQVYPVWYDGAAFRLISVHAQRPRIGQTRPACDAIRRGWMWQVPGVSGASDTVAVCAKDAMDAYGWRTLY